ncbi:SDR family oxidoreductase [Pseudomonas siliginis]|uniref:SDR family oxidoreductase n=1 Tax=Pseudomonas siliginis TaxID=2842346 RepID=UPI003C2AB175
MKKILIVGATSAIARECARLWAKDGSEFFLVARNANQLEQISNDLIARGATNTTSLIMDVIDVNQHQSMLTSCVAILKQIDIVLIAHGTLPNQTECQTDAQVAIKEFEINGLSTIALMTTISNQLEAQRHGSLVVISSVAGDRGRPSNYLYGSAKAAVTTFAEGLQARLFKLNVNVLIVKPGFVNTPMTAGLNLPEFLVAQPEEVAKQIIKAIEHKSASIYTPSFWLLIMTVIKLIPTTIFKRINL